MVATLSDFCVNVLGIDVFGGASPMKEPWLNQIYVVNRSGYERQTRSLMEHVDKCASSQTIIR
jgi:hypothetical protein